MHGMQDLANKYVDMYCKKQEKTKLKFKIDSIAAVRKTYDKEEEREFLDNWIDITDFQ